MKVSIFTPTHDPKYLVDLYDSIREQDFYEWVIVVNNGGALRPTYPRLEELKADVRVKFFTCDDKSGFVGALKRFACNLCTGDILLEVDHDDLLTASAIEDVKYAFTKPGVGFVYSNFAEFKGNFEPAVKYDLANGWQYRPFLYEGHLLEECVAFDSTPASVSRIWYAPNHLRAWRRSVYLLAGGHRTDMRVLDDQDLIARTYKITEFYHIDKCLYLYRITGENAYLKHNAEIQANVGRIYSEHILDLAIKWADSAGLGKLDLGAAHNHDVRLTPIDLTFGHDLNKPMLWADNSMGVIRANDILEHLDEKLHIIKEIYRVLAPGGYLFVMVPNALSQGGFQDPTHKQFYVENSFKYYTDRRFANYIGTPVRFQVMSLFTTPPNTDGVSWIVAHLVALKNENREVPGVINI